MRKTLLLFSSLLCTATFASAQGVGINNDGTLPDASAALDVRSNSKGVLVPRMMLTERNAIASPANGLLIYQTDATQGFYYNSGTPATPVWTYINASGVPGPEGPAGSANISGTTGRLIKFTGPTAGGNSIITENATGIGISLGSITPAHLLHVTGSGAALGYFTNSDAAGDALTGINSAANGTSAGAGVIGITGQANTAAAGVYGLNSNTNGTGVIGIGNNTIGSVPAAGSGGAFSGNITGVYARSNTGSSGEALLGDQFGITVRVARWDNTSSTFYKIIGTGTVSTIVKDLEEKPVVMHAPETPEIYFQDYGQGKLVNGKAHIALDPVFAKNITVSEAHPMRAFVQPEGDCKGVYITNKTATGFDVVELDGGTSNASFQWTVTCNRADEALPGGRISRNTDARFEPAPPTPELMQAAVQPVGRK